LHGVYHINQFMSARNNSTPLNRCTTLRDDKTCFCEVDYAQQLPKRWR